MATVRAIAKATIRSYDTSKDLRSFLDSARRDYSQMQQTMPLFVRTFRTFCALARDESGQGLVEYAIIIALVSIVAVATLRTLGHRADNALGSATNGFS